MEIPTFETKEELQEFVVLNKKTIIAAKKAKLKEADGIAYVHRLDEEGKVLNVNKNNVPIDTDDVTQLKVTAIINTTNIMDSHKDVHMPSIWKKSLQENKLIMHLQEHQMRFDKIIADGTSLKSFAKYYNWTELGFAYNGKTQALVFQSIVKRERNPFMFAQYAAGYVKNHSVGMRYVNLLLAVNNEKWAEEFAVWNKYIDKVVNREEVEAGGYFYPVLEAKVIEGSAVPLGSNIVTPTMDVTPKQNETIEFLKSLDTQFFPPSDIVPLSSTQQKDTEVIELLKELNNQYSF